MIKVQKNKILKRSISAGLVTGLILSFFTPQAEANNSVTSLTVAGFTVSWPQVMYVPTGCSRFEFRYINNAPYEFLQVGFRLTNQFGDHIASDSLIGAPPGRTGIWDEQICQSAVSGGLGPYKMKVYIEDYSSRGGGTLEQYADLFFTARPGATSVQPVVPIRPVVPGGTNNSVTSLTVAGFTVSWPQVMYVPTGCSRFEFRYINNAPYEFLQVGFRLTNQFGDHIASDSLIGAPPGRTGIWDEQICQSAVSGGLGPYKMKVYIEDYSSRGGGTLEQYADLFFTARPGAISVQPVVPEVTPATGSKTSTSKKKQTIVCVKGKLIKKVTNINPRCPAGFRKR